VARNDKDGGNNPLAPVFQRTARRAEDKPKRLTGDSRLVTSCQFAGDVSDWEAGMRGSILIYRGLETRSTIKGQRLRVVADRQSFQESANVPGTPCGGG